MRILKITGSSFAHIYMNQYTAKSGEKGVSRPSLILVETCFLRYQWVQFYSVMYISFVLWTCTLLEAVLAHVTCQTLNFGITAKSYDIVLCG